MGTRGPMLLLVLGMGLLVTAGFHGASRIDLSQVSLPLAACLVGGSLLLLIAHFWHQSVRSSLQKAVADREHECLCLAQDRLLEREQWNRSLFEDNPLVMLLIDPQTARIVDANPAACGFYGYPREELTRMAITDLNTLAASTVHERMQEALRGTTGRFVFRHRRADGSIRDVNVTSGPLRVANRTLLFSIIHDLTPQVQAKQAVERALAAKEQFLAALSHELRTPLTPVVLSIRTLLANDRITPSVREELLDMQHHVELEARLIDDLLDLTAIARGQLRLHIGECDLHGIIRRALAMCRSSALAKSLHISLDLQARSHCVQGDASRLQQVFWNLIKNAIKFTPDEGTITISTRDSNDAGPAGIICEVTDTGIGIEPSALPRIFSAFEQGSADVAHQFGGLGMGLAISQAIISMHEGKLTAASAGPNAAPSSPCASTLSTNAAPVPPVTACDDQPSATVLIIEDDPGTRRNLARLLKLWNYQVIAVDTAASALDAPPATSST